MPIAITEDQRALAAALTEWASGLDTAALTKDAEASGPAAWAPVAAGLRALGVYGIGVAEEYGGAGGSLVDVAVALEACARQMTPGPLLTTALAAAVLGEQLAAPAAKAQLPGIAEGTVTVAAALDAGTLTVDPEGAVRGVSGPVLGAGCSTHLLLPVDDDTILLVTVDAPGVRVVAGPGLDLAAPAGHAVLDGVAPTADTSLHLPVGRVCELAATLAAAEAAGVAHWCQDTAAEYAKVREQFGRPIGGFQAVKHLCAEILEASESATAVAWDAAAAHAEDREQFSLAAEVAAATAPDLAVEAAHTAIQVLGGIGFTWEHHAHLYLRRALSLRLWLPGADLWRLSLADRAGRGVRRSPHLDLGPEAEAFRGVVREELAAVAALPAGERREALATRGLLMPHWPAPYGRGASAVEQIVIDEEYAGAGLPRPPLGIGAWAAPTIVVHGSDEQRERFLGPTLRGEITWCQLFSEPGAGSDLASLRTRAARTEGGWLLSGQKVWTSLAAEADWAICLARTNPDVPQHKGITYFLVDMRTPGIDIRPLREMTGDALFNEVFLDEVFVPDDCVVGEVDGGWPLARNTLANERVAISDSSFGVSVERALRVVAEVGAGEITRARVGAAVAEAGVVKALGTRATLRSLSGQGPGPESSVLKLVGVRQRQDSAELALDLLGGAVLSGTGPWSDEVAAAVQEALVTRCLSIAGGTTQVLRNVAGERILGLPRG